MRLPFRDGSIRLCAKKGTGTTRRICSRPGILRLARESGDQLSTTFHDFDWADEVLHAAIGKKHLRPVFHGDFNTAFHRAEELARRIAEGLERDPMPADAPPADWWEKFASSVLGRPVAPAPKTHVKEWSPTTSASA